MKIKSINQEMNFVMPLEAEDGSKLYIHATPIDLDVFEEFSMLLAKTFASIHAEGLGNISGPRVAAMTLKHIGIEMGVTPAVSRLLNEIHRLMNTIVPRVDNSGWETVPFEEGIRREVFDKEDISEIDNAMVFFTLSWRMYHRGVRQKMMIGAALLWGGFITPLNCTEYAASLPISTTEKDGTETTSSAPS